MTNSTSQSYTINYGSTDTAENNLAFVRMLYRNILDRSGDQNGVNYWANQLNNHTITRDQLITNIFDSSEINNQFITAADAVTNAYRSLLQREPDIAGLDFWTNKITSGAAKISDVAYSFVHSNEFTKLQDTAVLPIVNTIWEDQASWDSITAEQLAKLIAYNPSGDGKTYPNQNLNFIVSGYGPLSTATLSDSAHYYTAVTTVPNSTKTVETQVSLASHIYMNPDSGKPGQYSASDPSYLVTFIKAISDEVSRLTNGQVKWATSDAHSTGSVGYHPDTTSYGYTIDPKTHLVTAQYLDYSHDWAGFQIPGGSTFVSNLPTDLPNTYKSFVDFTNYYNSALLNNGLKGFAQLIYETEGAYPDNPSIETDGSGVPYPNVYPTSSYINPQSVYGAPYQAGVFNNIISYVKSNSAWQVSGNTNGIKLAATSSPDAWMTSWGATQAFAQVYDLLNNGDYSNNPWPVTTSNLDPKSSSNTPANIASTFATFFANTTMTGIPAVSNGKYLLNNIPHPDQATGYDPAYTYVFSYGPGAYNSTNKDKESINQPIFQYGNYIFSNDSAHTLIPNPYPYVSQSDTYIWNATQFANFASSFGPDLSTNLNKISKQQFPISALPSIGVWGGERALDAWFGFVDLPNQSLPSWITDVKTIANGGSVSLASYIDDIYKALIGRIPTTAESDSLSKIATSTLNPATQDKVTITAEAAIINQLLKSASINEQNLTDTAFINHLYTDILGRAPDLLGAQYQTSLLHDGTARSAVVKNFITSNEFISNTGFNLKNATFSSMVNVLWQDNALSWTKAVNPNAASQLASLMQGNPNFTLVLDFLPEYSNAVKADQAWTLKTLTAFIGDLQTNHLKPTILFHPDATNGDAGEWFSNGIANGDATYQMANWMATLNSQLLQEGISSDYLLKGMVGEGKLLQKDWSTYSVFNSYYQAVAQNLHLPAQNIQLWDTGDWGSDNTLSSPVPIMTGTFVQLYDYYKGNYLLNILPKDSVGNSLTDPSMAAVIGKELLHSLTLPSAGKNFTPELLQNPKATVWTLNFSGGATGGATDAPVFGQGPAVYSPTGNIGAWDIDSINTLLSSLSDEAQSLYKANYAPPTQTQIAIWSAESLLNYIVPVSTTGSVSNSSAHLMPSE